MRLAPPAALGVCDGCGTKTGLRVSIMTSCVTCDGEIVTSCETCVRAIVASCVTCDGEIVTSCVTCDGEIMTPCETCVEGSVRKTGVGEAACVVSREDAGKLSTSSVPVHNKQFTLSRLIQLIDCFKSS